MRRSQFSLRVLMLGIACVAAALVMYRLLRTHNLPTELLASAIARFNSQAQESEVGALEPTLTEKEVIAAIQAQLPNLTGRPQVQQICQRIIDTGRLPTGASFIFFDGWERTNVPKQIVWWINLNLKTGNNHFYDLRIRENMQPAFAQTKGSN
jgi:hypothetical protein